MKQIILFSSTLLCSFYLMAQTGTSVTDSISRRNNTQAKSTVTNNTPTIGRYNSPYYESDYNSKYRLISNSTFNAALRKVRFATNSFDKKTEAKRLVKTYTLTAVQVSQLCNLMYGSLKLNLAMFAYSHCYDPFNYDVVLNNMDIQMANDLSEFISFSDDYENQNDDSYYPHNPYHNAGSYFNQTMSAQDFTNAKRTIENVSFENTKLETAKTIVGVNILTTAQIMEICRLFDFEATKLAFAKFAYDHTADKNNFYQVTNVFDFDNSKSALNQFIQNGGN